MRRLLDAGCGNGRHLVFFAEQGLESYGVDLSQTAIGMAKEWLVRKGLKAHVSVGDIAGLPFEDNYFDVIVSFGVLDHVPFAMAKGMMRELVRVLTDGGYIYLSLRSTDDAEFGRGEAVERNTYVLQKGYEQGIIQHYFDIAQIDELLTGFSVFDIEEHEQRFPDAYTLDKAFLQSSEGAKQHMDMSKPVSLGLKYSRWHIVAEKVRM